jgi:hypothetical protein
METARTPRPRITLTCSNCGALARLKMIEAFPFTKGVTEATYKCPECDLETKRAVGTADQISRPKVMSDLINPLDLMNQRKRALRAVTERPAIQPAIATSVRNVG